MDLFTSSIDLGLRDLRMFRKISKGKRRCVARLKTVSRRNARRKVNHLRDELEGPTFFDLEEELANYEMVFEELDDEYLYDQYDPYDEYELAWNDEQELDRRRREDAELSVQNLEDDWYNGLI